MTKRIITMSLVLCLILSLSSVVSPALAKSAEPSATTASVADVNTARFLNMLNHSFVYDDAFNYTDDLVNASVIALLDYCDADGEFIAEGVVRDYVMNMYGVDIVDFSELNADFPHKEGYVFVIPRGFSTYHHTLVDCLENEDGSYTVTTEVEINNHEGDTVTATAVTLFVKNSESDFGYNIIYSNIAENASAM